MSEYGGTDCPLLTVSSPVAAKLVKGHFFSKATSIVNVECHCEISETQWLTPDN